ncbi:MAG: YbaB/EbfC family nucleoid-associated protein [Kutzneria sp.]|nr:YbaB/EbfC family nucleoid-associated protein [Kutzneria sp.]
MIDSERVAELLASNLTAMESMQQLLTNCRRELATAQRLTRTVRRRTAHAQSPDRMVTVIVDGTGALMHLTFDQDTFAHHSPASLAVAITDTVRRASHQLDDESAVEVSHSPPALPESGTSAHPAEPSASTELIAPESSTSLTANLGDPSTKHPQAPASVNGRAHRAQPNPSPDASSEIDHVLSALNKLPSYTGIVTRVLGVRDPDRAAAIADQFQPGETIIERTFLSTSANPAYTGDGLIRYTIEAKHHGKLIGGFSQDGEAFGEVVFGPGCRFRVTGKRYYPSVRCWDIALEETS